MTSCKWRLPTARRWRQHPRLSAREYSFGAAGIASTSVIALSDARRAPFGQIDATVEIAMKKQEVLSLLERFPDLVDSDDLATDLYRQACDDSQERMRQFVRFREIGSSRSL